MSTKKAANVIVEFSEKNFTDTEQTISLVDPEEVKREILESNDMLDRIIKKNIRNSKKIELSKRDHESPAWLSKKTDALGVSVLGKLNSSVFNFNKSTINAEDNYEPPQGVRNKIEALRNPNFTPNRNQHDGGEMGQTLFSGSNGSDSTRKYKILTKNQNPTIATNPRSQNSKNHDLIGKLMTNNNYAISIRSKREIPGVDISGRRQSDLTEGPRQDSKTRIQRQLDEFRRGKVLLLTRNLGSKNYRLNDSPDRKSLSPDLEFPSTRGDLRESEVDGNLGDTDRERPEGRKRNLARMMNSFNSKISNLREINKSNSLAPR